MKTSNPFVTTFIHAYPLDSEKQFQDARFFMLDFEVAVWPYYIQSLTVTNEGAM